MAQSNGVSLSSPTGTVGGLLPGRPRRGSIRKAQATVSYQVFGACVAASLMYNGSCSQHSWVSELLPRMSTSSQAPRLQDQPVLSDRLYVLAAQRLPKPHLHF